MHIYKKFIFFIFLSISVTSNSKILPFSENYDDMKTAHSNKGFDELAKLNWKVTGKVFKYKKALNIKFPGEYLYFYGKWFPAPNNTSGSFSGIEKDPTDKKNNFLNIYNDYNNRGAHEKGFIVNAIFAKEFKISKKDINKTIILNFDAKRPNKINYGNDYDYSQAVGNACKNICEAQAFIKIMNPKNQWAVTRSSIKNTSKLSQEKWTNHSIQLKIDNKDLMGQILQVGFESYATGDDNTGVYYDNLSLTVTD